MIHSLLVCLLLASGVAPQRQKFSKRVFPGAVSYPFSDYSFRGSKAFKYDDNNFVRPLPSEPSFSPEWTYERQDKWLSKYPGCGGNEQSPIDLKYKWSEPSEFRGLKFSPGYYEVLTSSTLLNNGHTVQLNMLQEQKPILSYNRNLYVVDNVHIHWGASDDVGSEHALDGEKYAAEVHLVHYNSKYKNLQGATNQPDGILVVAILYYASNEKNSAFAGMFSRLGEVRESGSSVAVDSGDFIVLAKFLPQNTKDFYRYKGSLTTPPCTEGITWIVMATPEHISRKQVNRLRSLRESDGRRLSQNWRDLQSHERRVVKSSVRNESFQKKRFYF